MLKKIRVFLGVTIFLSITLLFLDFTGSLHHCLDFLAKIQLVPALLALNLFVLIGLLVGTFLLGRLYCSIICPLGVFQDAIAKLGRRGKKRPYSYSKAKNILRYSMLLIYFFALISGVSIIASLLDPYAAYGRMAHSFGQPLWEIGNNILAYFAERADSYAFYTTEVWIKSIVTFAVAVITFIAISILAWKNGRTYCNTICPVGTLLGIASRFSLYKIILDSKKCTRCKKCASHCKAACIDVSNYQVDHSRCVTCMNCLEKCKEGAIQYQISLFRAAKKESETTIEESNSRRGFVGAIVAVVAGAAVAKAQQLPKQVEMKMDGGLADILDKEDPKREFPIIPPGAMNQRHFSQNCTACQLCVSACPNGVLKPSTALETFMQPALSFQKGYCRPECVECGNVCPTSAISPIDVAQKSATQIGRALWQEEMCVVVRKGERCYNCSRQCPTQAITMIDRGFAHPVPIIDTERCIGCGACENLCPSRPISAIYVEGNHTHRTI